MSSSWHMINFIIALVAIILVLIIYFIVYEHRDDVRSGIPWTIVRGTTTLSADIVPTGGKVIYMSTNTTNKEVTVTVKSSINNVTGTHIKMINYGTSTLNVAPDTGMTFTPTKSFSLTEGESADLYYTTSNNFSYVIFPKTL